MSPNALIITGDGINCEEETAFALSQAGAQCQILHINQLIAHPGQLSDAQILALPGGFSFGDEVSSGKILALKLQQQLGELLQTFISEDKLVIGICNGFQALVKLGILPRSDAKTQQVTLTHNRQKRFINRWVTVQANPDTLFFKGLSEFMLPIRHGEGRLIVPEDTPIAAHIGLTYTDDVNGSHQQIAGLINERGNVLGLMPHPEAFVRWTQHPAWTSMTPEERQSTPPGLQIFQNMVSAVRNGQSDTPLSTAGTPERSAV